MHFYVIVDALLAFKILIKLSSVTLIRTNPEWLHYALNDDKLIHDFNRYKRLEVLSAFTNAVSTLIFFLFVYCWILCVVSGVK